MRTAAQKLAAAKTNDASILYPAMETPNSDQGTWSQAANLVPRSCWRRSAALALGSKAGAWHSAVPRHHNCSTPT